MALKKRQTKISVVSFGLLFLSVKQATGTIKRVANSCRYVMRTSRFIPSSITFFIIVFIAEQATSTANIVKIGFQSSQQPISIMNQSSKRHKQSPATYNCIKSREKLFAALESVSITLITFELYLKCCVSSGDYQLRITTARFRTRSASDILWGCEIVDAPVQAQLLGVQITLFNSFSLL